MISDNISNFEYYIPLHECFRKAFEFLIKDDLHFIKEGRYDIDEKGTYVMIQEYIPKDISKGVIECHKKYIDIQFIIKGVETIGICNKALCKENDYDFDKDFQKLEGTVDFITLKEGHFAVFMPQDGHMPGIVNKDYNDKVRKAVIKVPVL